MSVGIVGQLLRDPILGGADDDLRMVRAHLVEREMAEAHDDDAMADAGQALQQALQLCELLNARAPNALASIKDLLADADDNSLTTHLARERDHFVKNLHHPNAGIGIGAFLNKKNPKYD